jgi:hypothetical protein
MIGPYSIAFPDAKNSTLSALDIILNVLFAMDIVINFFCAYYDENFTVIDDLSVMVIYLIKFV